VIQEAELIKENEGLRQQITELKVHADTLSRRNTHLTADRDHQKTQVAVTRKRLAHFRDESKRLGKTVGRREETIRKGDETIRGLMKEKENVENQLPDLKRKHSSLFENSSVKRRARRGERPRPRFDDNRRPSTSSMR
jgi:chromosome segregation ATPase